MMAPSRDIRLVLYVMASHRSQVWIVIRLSARWSNPLRTIRIVLTIALSKSWPIHQLDVHNAFFHGNLHEAIYMHQPLGFRDSHHSGYVCRLKKSFYGLKQAPRAWYKRFADYVTTICFRHSTSDHSLFIYRQHSNMAYILLYVDDIILITSTPHPSQINYVTPSILVAFFSVKAHTLLRSLSGLAWHLANHQPLLSIPSKNSAPLLSHLMRILIYISQPCRSLTVPHIH